MHKSSQVQIKQGHYDLSISAPYNYNLSITMLWIFLPNIDQSFPSKSVWEILWTRQCDMALEIFFCSLPQNPYQSIQTNLYSGNGCEKWSANWLSSFSSNTTFQQNVSISTKERNSQLKRWPTWVVVSSFGVFYIVLLLCSATVVEYFK